MPKVIENQTDLHVTEMEYQELSSVGWDNVRFNLRIKTTPLTYKDDFAKLVIEVKSRLQELADMKKKEKVKTGTGAGK